ncbi:hypothetical protein ACFQ0B_74955 [Nonomuraea thailandensis]
MEGDHRVWPPQPGPRHRRTPPSEDTEPAWGARRDEEPRQGRASPPDARQDPPPGPARSPAPDPPWDPARSAAQDPPPGPGRARPPEPPPAWGRRGRPYAEEPGWGPPAPPGQLPRRPHPLDLDLEPEPGPEDEEPGWNPRIRRTVPRDPVPARGHEDPWDDALPPSARLHGTPRDPGAREGRPGGGRLWRRAGLALAALAAGAGLVAGTTAVALRLTAPPGDTGRLSDALAGVAATLPQGWSAGAVPPVTGFTSVVRDGRGGS